MFKKALKGSSVKDSWFLYTDKHCGVCLGATSNDGNKIHAKQNTDCKSESWNQSLRGPSSLARNHLAVWALVL